jgi:tetratricopeptide (TPR) repeat protein
MISSRRKPSKSTMLPYVKTIGMWRWWKKLAKPTSKRTHTRKLSNTTKRLSKPNHRVNYGMRPVPRVSLERRGSLFFFFRINLADLLIKLNQVDQAQRILDALLKEEGMSIPSSSHSTNHLRFSTDDQLSTRSTSDQSLWDPSEYVRTSKTIRRDQTIPNQSEGESEEVTQACSITRCWSATRKPEVILQVRSTEALLSSTDVGVSLLSICYRLAMSYLDEHDYEAAIKDLKEASAIDDRNLKVGNSESRFYKCSSDVRLSV